MRTRRRGTARRGGHLPHGRLHRGSHEAGVLLATDGLKPSSEGKRVRLQDGKLTVTDGPWRESKELVGIVRALPGLGDGRALYWTKPFPQVLGSGAVELRPIYEPTDFPAEVFSPEELAHEERVRRAMEEKRPALEGSRVPEPGRLRARR